MGEQMKSIKTGVDIITCTPGRIRALIQEGNILTDQIRFFVIDEADSMLGQSDSSRIIQELHSSIPKYNSTTGQRFQMIVCSATLHNMGVQKLAVTFILNIKWNKFFVFKNQYMYFPAWIDLKGQDVVPDTVHQVICMVDPREDKSWIRLRSNPGQSVKVNILNKSKYLFNILNLAG